MRKLLSVLSAAAFITLSVFALVTNALEFSDLAAPTLQDSGNADVAQYFTVDDGALNAQSPLRNFLTRSGFQSPLSLITNGDEGLGSSQGEKPADSLNLTQWIQHQAGLPAPAEKYNRKKHFGTWARTETDCQNTRAKILIQNSKKPVTFTMSDNCTVLEGEWDDPYSGKTYTKAGDLQIDHLVPLKNAYDMGAWAWNNQKRCLYGNFLANPFHLLAVDGTENNKKSAKTPAEYMPANQAYACSYIQEWLTTKTIWNLAMTQAEVKAIAQLIQQNSCPVTQMQASIDFMKKQRSQSAQSLDLCWNNFNGNQPTLPPSTH